MTTHRQKTLIGGAEPESFGKQIRRGTTLQSRKLLPWLFVGLFLWVHVSGATNWLANFTVTVSFLPLLTAVGLAGAYGLYGLAALVSLLFVWTAVRETKGKTLEEM
jgi:hypothetical protein